MTMQLHETESLMQELSLLVSKYKGSEPLKDNETIILTDDELSDLFKISKVTLYRYRRSGNLPYQKVGNVVTYRYDDVMLSLRTSRLSIKGMTKPQAIEHLTNYKKMMQL